MAHGHEVAMALTYPPCMSTRPTPLAFAPHLVLSLDARNASQANSAPAVAVIPRPMAITA